MRKRIKAALRATLRVVVAIGLIVPQTGVGLAFADAGGAGASGGSGAAGVESPATLATALTAENLAAGDASAGGFEMQGATGAAAVVEQSITGSAPDFSKLNGTNWMSGVDGQRKLSDINIPGTHDSGCNKVYSAYLYAAEDGAKTQSRYIEEQLEDGVRIFDLRLTDYNQADWAESATSIWISHGTFWGKLNFLYYGCAKDDGKVMRLWTVMKYFDDFLKAHPSETLIVQIAPEYTKHETKNEKGETVSDYSNIWQKARNTLLQWRNIIYKEPGSAFDEWKFNTMPKLEDARGKIVFCSKSPSDLGYGMQLVTQNNQADMTVGGVDFRYENQYEKTDEQKLEQVKRIYTEYNQDLPRNLRSSVRKAVFANTSSNRAGSLGQRPATIAKTVNRALYEGADPFFKIGGKYYGWVNSDFMTAPMAERIWKNNFPNDLQYAKVRYKSQSGTVVRESTMMVGSKVKLPTSAGEFAVPGTTFHGWDVNGFSKEAGEEIVIEEDTDIVADNSMEWSDLRTLIVNTYVAGGPGTITLTQDVSASTSFRPSNMGTIPDSELTINLNGKTLDVGSAGITVAGNSKLTLNGPGILTGKDLTMGSKLGAITVEEGATLTLQGGMQLQGCRSFNGAGVNVKDGATLNVADATITGNTATKKGGGVYVHSRAKLNVSGAAKVIGNKVQASDGAEAAASNVYLDKGALVTVNGALSGDARIGVTSADAGAQAGAYATVVTSGLRNRGSASNITSDSGSYVVAANSAGEAALQKARTVKFDTHGGSVVKPQAVTTGDRVMRPSDPSMSHAGFGGWYTDADLKMPYDFSAPVTADMTLHAKWNPWTYAVKIDKNDGSAATSQTVQYGAKVAKPDDPIREGYEFTGWEQRVVVEYTGGTYNYWVDYNFDSPVTCGFVLRAKWKKRGDCAVSFNSNGGSAVDAQSIAYGGKAARPADPVMGDKRFAGWFSDADLTKSYDFETPVTDVLTLYAKWEAAQAGLHLVAFDSNGGTSVGAVSVSNGQVTPAPPEPTREGYTFDGWYASSSLDGSPFDFDSTPITGDMMLHAKWTVDRFTVSFDAGTGKAADNPSAQLNVEYDGHAIEPGAIARDGYEFLGWFRVVRSGLDDDDIAAMQAEFARNPGYADVFWLDEEGKTLLGKHDFRTHGITGPTTLRARWVELHTVAFDSGGAGAVAFQTVCHGETAIEPPEPVRDRYLFDGWYASDSSGGLAAVPFDFTTPITGDVSLSAGWVKEKCAVTFNGNGGGAVDSQTIDGGDVPSKPAEPVKEGSLFIGWYELWSPSLSAEEVQLVKDSIEEDPSLATEFWLDEENALGLGAGGTALLAAYDFVNGCVIEDTTLYARWTDDFHTVTFDAGAVDAISPVARRVIDGYAVERPADPVRAGYLLEGWYTSTGITVADEGDGSSGGEPDGEAGAADISITKADYDALVEQQPDLAENLWLDGADLRFRYDFDQGVGEDLELKARWVTSIANAPLMLSGTSFVYNGKVQKPVVANVGGKTLVEGVDYTCVWSNANSTNVGSYTVKAVGKGDYGGTSAAAAYAITKADQPIAGLSETYSRTFGDAAFNLGASAPTLLSYRSSNVQVASVSPAGRVTIVGAGEAKITVSAGESGNYKPASKTVTVKVAKASQSIRVKTTKKTYKASKLKSKARKFTIGAKASGGGKLSYKVTKKNAKLKFSKGKVTVAKGAKRGTYKMKVKIRAKATANFNAPKAKTVTIAVKVK